MSSSPENLQVLCEWCHMKADHLGKPLFDELLARIDNDPNLRAELRTQVGVSGRSGFAQEAAQALSP